ncbi:MAG: PilZ domain-containing protein [Clostridia bacterium]|nr:PilZ domain-containing protein [Clostridia bacterium]
MRSDFKEVVEINHFSIEFSFRGYLTGINPNGTMDLVIASCVPLIDFKSGDPLTITYKAGEKIARCEGTIISSDLDQRRLNIFVEEEVCCNERRVFERYPVSLHVRVCTTDGKSETASIKDLSSHGMGIVSKAEFSTEQLLNCSFYLEDREIQLDSMVVWKLRKELNIHYGLQFICVNETNISRIEDYIKEMKRKDREIR